MRPKLSPKKRARNLVGSGLNPPFEKVEETNESNHDDEESSTSMLRSSTRNSMAVIQQIDVSQ